MTYRFILGALFASVGNLIISWRLLDAHELMERQELWQYMFVLPYNAWQVWPLAFAVSGTGALIALLFGRDNWVRRMVGVGTVALLCWLATLGLSAIDGKAQDSTGLVPTFLILIAGMELVFLGLQSRDWLDKVRTPGGEIAPSGDDSLRRL